MPCALPPPPPKLLTGLFFQLVTMVLDVGESGRVPSLPSPLMYSWYEEHYLGAAHGLAGIFTVLLQVSQLSKKAKKHSWFGLI